MRWAFDLVSWRPSLKELEQAVACIQPEEKERLAKFVFRDDFDASLVGRLLMRRFVKACLPQIDYSAISLGRDERGKPYLASSVSPSINIDFNVSHHESYTVIAGTFSDDASSASNLRIGVDVMRNEYSGGKQLKEFFRLMRRTFTPNEWRFIESRADERQQAAAFMRHWCLKESYVKNIGVGITINLQSIDFRLADSVLSADKLVRNSQVCFEGAEQPNWFFEESTLDAEHCVAVSVKNPTQNYRHIPDEELMFQVIDFESLMRDSQPLLAVDTEYCRAVMAKEYKRK